MMKITTVLIVLKFHCWLDVVKIDPNPKKPANPYRISASMNMVKLAVYNVKNRLGWVEKSTSSMLDFQ